MTERELLLWALKGDPGAVLFVESLSRISQVWDDLIDGDATVPHGTINAAFREALTGIPRNPFFLAYRDQLLPVMDVVINDWLTANVLEKGSEDDKHVAWVIRDSLCALLTFCAQLLGGHEWAEQVSITVRRWTHDESLEVFANG